MLNIDLQVNIKHGCHILRNVSKRSGVKQSWISVSIFYTTATLILATAFSYLVLRAVAVNQHAVSILGFAFQQLLLSSLVLAMCSYWTFNATAFSGWTDMKS